MRAFTLLFFLFAGCAPWGATMGPKSSPAPTPKALDAFVRRQLEERSLLGLSVAVVHHGRVLLSRGYGRRKIKGSDPVRIDTMFGIGSITKQFLCAAALLLAQDGKLSLDDPVAKYFPGLTNAQEIRLIDLLTHRSGYPDYYPLDFTDRRMLKPIDSDELIRRYATGKLDFPPRTRWSYSNTGFIIAGRVLEKVSGQSLGTLFQRRLFEPIGMSNTRYQPARSGPRIAQGASSFALGPPEPAVFEATGWLGAAARIYSTAADLVKWDLALIDGRVLKPASLELMTRPQSLPGGRRAFYGCGLSVASRRGQTIVRHDGSVAGFVAFNAVVPGTRSAVAVISNLHRYHQVAKIHARLLAAILPKPGSRGQHVPRVAGEPAVEVVRKWFRRFQTGQLDRRQLGAEFSAFLTPRRVRGAAARLAAYGSPEKVQLLRLRERGAMEVAVVRLSFGRRALRAVMYRSADGKIQELLWGRD